MASNPRKPKRARASYSSVREREPQSADPGVADPGVKVDWSEREDVELLAGIADGNAEALEALYDRHGRGIYSLAHHVLQEHGAAEEVTQDTFFNVWRRASTYRPSRGNVTAWLYAIGHHRIIDELRKRRRNSVVTYVPDVEALRDVADHSVDLSKSASRVADGKLMRKALDTLKPELRAVVSLAYYGGMSQSEIARKLDTPLGTVKTRTIQAFKALRERLGPQARKWFEDG